MESVIVFLAKYLIFAIVAVVAFVSYTTERRREFLIAVVLAVVLALDLALIADALYYSPRPFVSGNIEPLIPHEPDNGFPSMHTVLAMTLSAVMYFYWRQLAALAFILTLLVGVGRVWAHVHSWIDIFGGLVIGAIAGYAGVKLTKFLLARFIAKKPESHR